MLKYNLTYVSIAAVTLSPLFSSWDSPSLDTPYFCCTSSSSSPEVATKVILTRLSELNGSTALVHISYSHTLWKSGTKLYLRSRGVARNEHKEAGQASPSKRRRLEKADRNILPSTELLFVHLLSERSTMVLMTLGMTLDKKMH